MFKIAAIVLLLAGSFSSCGKRGENLSQNVYYVVGWDGTSEVDLQKGTVKAGGYLLISENLKDSLLIDNMLRNEEDKIFHLGYLFDDIFDFPVETMREKGPCAWAFFPEEYRFAFKVQINSYRPATENEELLALRGVNWFLCYRDKFIHDKFKCVVIISISKIE